MAVSDEDEVVATPVRTLQRRGGARDVEAVVELARDLEAAALLLGLPLELDGGEGAAARRVRALGRQLEARVSCAVEYWDERFSTVAAERALLEADMSRRRRKQVIDKVAAAVILQAFLDARGAPGGRT